jgi:1-pyrroline-5-carboxylate dehydrogenase
MSNSTSKVPAAVNEPVKSYAPGSPEKIELEKTLQQLRSSVVDIPMTIGGKKVYTEQKVNMHPPHETSHLLGTFNKGSKEHVSKAIAAALEAKEQWENTPWEHRAAIFLKAADLLTGPYRAKMNAATMLAQSKNAFQAEIDAVCELADFFRFNVEFMAQMYQDQPYSPSGQWNRLEYRPLEGFVFALTPFNFTSIAGNLPCAPALMGNTVVWKPAESQIYSAQVIIEILEEAGLPPGVVNLIFVDGATAGSEIFSHKAFSGLHFTGSTGVFQNLWKTIGNHIQNYNTYPRIVGETGGKDFVFVHPSAHPEEVATALVRGAFEFQGQKCSAASRAYIPKSLWKEIEQSLQSQLAEVKMGPPEDFSNFVNAVIDKKAFAKITSYIEAAKTDEQVQIIAGGEYSDEKGYFIQPTVLLTKDPHYITMEEEIFGPVLTLYLYEEEALEETLDILDQTSPYALTGAIFAKDRYAVDKLTERLKHCAGNFYINDKPTGAVVGQQPFGGARGSGTNDKAGSILNLYRWVSARNIKETFVPPRHFKYPFLG